jgi:hypothetical protein
MNLDWVGLETPAHNDCLACRTRTVEGDTAQHLKHNCACACAFHDYRRGSKMQRIEHCLGMIARFSRIAVCCIKETLIVAIANMYLDRQ